MNLPKLSQEDINNVNRSVMSNEIGTVIKNLPTRWGKESGTGVKREMYAHMNKYKKKESSHKKKPRTE
jgi:hypothetical protein